MRHSQVVLLGTLTVVAGVAISLISGPSPQGVAHSAASPQLSLAQVNQELGEILSALDLTDGQIQQLQTVKRQYQPMIEEQTAQSQAVESELLELVSDADSDTALRTQFQQVTQSRQELMQIRLENVLAIRNILTPEQRQELVNRLMAKDSTSS